jgi:hypothetical protein
MCASAPPFRVPRPLAPRRLGRIDSRKLEVESVANHRIRTALVAILTIVVGATLATAPALADDDPIRTDFPSAYDNPALESWQDSQKWRYDSDYLFGMTRGLKTAGVPAAARPAAWIFSVPFDLALLPIAAIAGLFSD